MGIIKQIVKKGVVVMDDLLDYAMIRHLQMGEIRKFKDSRRKRIYESVTLSQQQQADINSIFKHNYGKTIPHTWHKHFSAFTGKFDKYYFPELLYIPEFEHYMNHNNAYCKVFADKNIIPMIAQAALVWTPKTIILCSEGLLRNNNRLLTKKEALDYLSNIGELFIKPSTDSCSGRGCFAANFCNGRDTITGKSVADILGELGSNYVVQERLKCHDSIAQIYPNSVNTFRVITYRWKDDIFVMPVIMRIGRGNAIVDNAHAGGIFIAVNNDGVLHKTAFTEFKESYTVHPDTNTVFEGYKIDHFEKVVDAAKCLHATIPQVGVYNWDFTIDRDGNPVLIEANTKEGSPWMLQMAHGCGPFGERTPEILRWIRLCRSLPKSKRKKYAYGYMPEDRV